MSLATTTSIQQIVAESRSAMSDSARTTAIVQAIGVVAEALDRQAKAIDRQTTAVDKQTAEMHRQTAAITRGSYR